MRRETCVGGPRPGCRKSGTGVVDDVSGRVSSLSVYHRLTHSAFYLLKVLLDRFFHDENSKVPTLFTPKVFNSLNDLIV